MKMMGQEPGELDDMAIATIGHGINGTIQEMMFGDVLQVSNRFAMADGINQAVKLLVNEEIPDAASLMGPAGSTVSKGLNAITGMWGLYVSPDDVELTRNDLLAAWQLVSPIIGTVNNGTKAMMMHRTEGILSKNGTKTIDIDVENEFNLIVGKALGFQSLKEQSVWNLVEYNNSRKQRINKGVDALLILENQYLKSWNGPSDEDNRNFAARKAVLQTMFNKEELAEVQLKAQSRRDKDNMWDQQLSKAIDNYLTSGRTREGMATILNNPALSKGEE